MELRKNRLWIVAVVALTVGVSGCLKTRAQLREDSSEEKDFGRPVSVRPAQEVRPQGQYVIDELKEEMTRMEGRMGDLERSQQELAAKAGSGSGHKEVFKALESRISQLEQIQANLSEELNKVQQSAVDPEEYLAKAKASLKASDHPAVIEALTSYLKSPKAKKLEEALLMRAEAFYKAKEFKKAIVDYSKFPEKHPRSPYMSQALYKIGLCFDALGMKDDAKGFYQEVVEKYPKSPEAKKARNKVK